MKFLKPQDRERAAWRIICPHHGPVFLTREEYKAQMMAPNSRWECPAWEDGNPQDPEDPGPGICGAVSYWDDQWYALWTSDGTEQQEPQ